ncbi:hypothetical protein VP381E491_P0026 [Vibrio phage 381E49-1]|nr:hypothetical protein VP381E491_P0026 [Vibrio phage 381E49-1]
MPVLHILVGVVLWTIERGMIDYVRLVTASWSGDVYSYCKFNY